MNKRTTIRVDVHIQDDTSMRIVDHLDQPNPFVTVRIGDASLFISNIPQATALCTLAMEAVDAFVLAGEPVSA